MAESEFNARTPEIPAEAEAPAPAPVRRRTSRAKRSRRRWRRFLLVYTILFLLLGAAACFVLYRYSAAYEASLPEHVMDRLMAETDDEQWYAAARGGADLDVSECEDGQALFDAYCDAVFRGSPVSYRKFPGAWTAKTPVYAVRCAGRDLCRVELVPDGSGAVCASVDGTVLPAPPGSASLIHETRTAENMIRARTAESIFIPCFFIFASGCFFCNKYITFRVEKSSFSLRPVLYRHASVRTDHAPGDIVRIA